MQMGHGNLKRARLLEFPAIAVYFSGRNTAPHRAVPASPVAADDLRPRTRMIRTW